MIIYLASGFPVSHVEGREKELYNKFKTWNRLASFYFIIDGYCQILNLIKQEKKRQKK